jgi:hypothetical protein
MGHPKKSTKARQDNLAKAAAHKHHWATNDRTPVEAKKTWDLSENVEKEGV